jgi:hypothetical protein
MPWRGDPTSCKRAARQNTGSWGEQGSDRAAMTSRGWAPPWASGGAWARHHGETNHGEAGREHYQREDEWRLNRDGGRR